MSYFHLSIFPVKTKFGNSFEVHKLVTCHPMTFYRLKNNLFWVAMYYEKGRDEVAIYGLIYWNEM